MPEKYKIRPERFLDAIAARGISSAAQLATLCEISKGTAERVMRREAISRAVVVSVVTGLSNVTGAPAVQVVASELFEAAQ